MLAFFWDHHRDRNIAQDNIYQTNYFLQLNSERGKKKTIHNLQSKAVVKPASGISSDPLDWPYLLLAN